ncbi:MAG: hypothetical protein HDP34_04370 [Clostridia bacterium]|nr:hypothetical protein [Clostridia bacterium]
MAKLQLKLEKQLLTLKNQEIIASGDSNFDSCIFTFDESWSGFVKTAVFYQDKINVQYMVLENDDTCMIPAAAMARAGRMYIGVFGIKDTAVVTSTLITVDIKEGAISGDTVSTEPTDDVFLAIIAQYQRIAEMMRKYEETAAQFNDTMKEQNRILETLNAFDVIELNKRLDDIEDRIISYTDLAQELIDREVIIRDVSIQFVEGVCDIENEVITQDSLCDIYFDEYSYEFAANALIMVSSYDGYIRVTSSVNIAEKLNANILVRRY